MDFIEWEGAVSDELASVLLAISETGRPLRVKRAAKTGETSGQFRRIQVADSREIRWRKPAKSAILAELHRDQKVEVGQDATLGRWAEEGVLLLNTALTVGARPGSDLAIWNAFTSVVLGALAARRSRPIVFLLWGEHAKSWRQAVEQEPHAVVTAPHPASRGRGPRFKGSRPFGHANEELARRGEPPIDWRVAPAV